MKYILILLLMTLVGCSDPKVYDNQFDAVKEGKSPVTVSLSGGTEEQSLMITVYALDSMKLSAVDINNGECIADWEDSAHIGTGVKLDKEEVYILTTWDCYFDDIKEVTLETDKGKFTFRFQ